MFNRKIIKRMWDNLFHAKRNGKERHSFRGFILTGSLMHLIVFPMLINTWINELPYDYPDRSNLNVDEGMFCEVRKGKTYFWQLDNNNGKLLLARDKYSRNLIPLSSLYKDGERTPHPAKILWFKLPSGIGWLAELEVDGKLLSNYEQRKKDLYQNNEDYAGWYKWLWLSSAGIIALIIEYIVSARQIRKEEKSCPDQ